ncbi:DNA-directed RNA polymerase subunit A' [Candidatus Woesearchaeota archaeon]|nr:DNA-directed RNA polymerase subunit A' [Candidatus Woesearchaeota archaeon]
MEDNEPSVFKKVDKISFGVFSPKMIKKMSAAKIVTPELYDKEGYPVDGGLMDTRLGVIDPGLKCRTCGCKLKECFGHFGYIDLARPVIHIKYVTLVLNMLKCTCRECGKILYSGSRVRDFIDNINKAEEESGHSSKKASVKSMVTSLKTINKCPHCKAKQHKITVDKPSTFYENDKRLTPIEIRIRLEKISDDDCEILGLNPKSVRPEWLILTILSIPPVTMRPSITLESGERSEDDLTHKLGDIVRINQRLFENINAGAPEIIIEDLWDLLQYHITTFFDNNIAQLPPARHRSGQPLKTITERIKSKEGRIRHNLAGKRTNFSARTVISPDPLLDLNEVGVPNEIAQKLTVPERVTEWNMEYLKEFVDRGPKKYPGANYIIRPDGKKKKITDDTKETFLEEIEPGYVIERHLMDGDIAIFNRQPSLHRMSMMCHKVRVLPYRTFRLNPAVCAPYNADFDGDEMNLHIPQTEEARAEAELLIQVQTQLISPRYGLSIIGCNQDAITGNFLLTREMDSLTYNEAVDLLSAVGEDSFSKLPKKDIVSGKDVVSCILPNDFNFVGHSKSCRKCVECEREKCQTDSYILIKSGNLKTGVLDKSNLGEGSGLLLRDLHKKYGADMTVSIIGKLFRLGIMVLLKRGFSCLISDMDLPSEGAEKIQGILQEAEKKIEALIKVFHDGEMEALPGRSIVETLELRILELLNKARNDTGEVVLEYSDMSSPTSIMVHSGARGNIINLAQMSAVVGQQALRGKRIDFGFKGRTLSCFKKGDLRPSARGFISSSFKSGLKPHEFFFAAMTGRDSLMDTALRTPKSGYLYRRLANAMQDVKVEYDYTVREANTKIVQFSYGEDGIDVSKSENGFINIKKIIEEVTES